MSAAVQHDFEISGQTPSRQKAGPVTNAKEPRTPLRSGEGSRGATAGPTDDEILGIAVLPKPDEPQLESRLDDQAGESTVGTADSRDAAKSGDVEAKLEAALKANPELKRAWEDAQAYRELFKTPADAHAATASLADLARMDGLFFSGRPEDHAELARAVASLNPVAFRSLAQAMSKFAGETAQGSGGTAGASENLRANDMRRDSSGLADSQTGGNSSEHREQTAAQDRGAENLDARGVTPAQEAFFHSTNEAAVRTVVEAIESQVARLVPPEISKGARNRLVGEIYRELDTSLRSDPQFAQQARQAFRSGALDESHRRAIISLVNSRARQALPAVARRVLGEWTTAIVAANQDRRVRQRAAEGRVDIAGSGRTGSDGARPMTPKDINYMKMSDADILNL